MSKYKVECNSIGEVDNCTCPHHTNRKALCKHIAVVCDSTGRNMSDRLVNVVDSKLELSTKGYASCSFNQYEHLTNAIKRALTQDIKVVSNFINQYGQVVYIVKNNSSKN